MTTETANTETELEQLLEEDIAFDTVRIGELFAERLRKDEERTLALISLRIQSLLARIEPLARQREAMLEHCRSVATPLQTQIQSLSDIVSATLLERRRRNPNVKSLTLLGVGEWKSRKVGSGWDIDEKAALENLTPDERLAYAEQREHLKSAALREYLDTLIAPAKREITDDMDAEERTERLRAMVEAIEKQYGVTYRPERISVKGPLE